MPPGSVNATIIRMNGMTDPYDGAFLRAEGFFRNSFVTEWQQRIMYFFSYMRRERENGNDTESENIGEKREENCRKSTLK